LKEFDTYLDLVGRLSTGDLNRSENDLSSNLKSALAGLGLHGVLDTGAGDNRAKRPDILLYTDLAAADVGGAADVVVEAKKPHEVARFVNLVEALAADEVWSTKFVPYVQAHAARVRYFILTTFERFLAVPVTTALRHGVRRDSSYPDRASRLEVLAGAVTFDLRSPGAADALVAWCATHLTPTALVPPPLSTIVDVSTLGDVDALEQFAGALADVVVGPEGRPTTGGALLASIRVAGRRLDDLEPAVQQGLVIYTMAAHGGMGVEVARAHLERHLQDELAEFVNASVHSLVGRLFAVKAIEDGFCIGTHPPLIPPDAWVFHSDRFDALAPEELPSAFFAALGGLARADNPAVQDLAATGRFYDWLSPQVDPAAFRRLLELFFASNLARLDGDLLGRFFEIYAQRVDRRRRRQLGQYYTPLPIVRHMWRLSLAIARERGAVRELVALDPGVGSGTFLIEGARCVVPG
jgi:hypothetical protein